MALAGPAGLLAALCAAPASSVADSSLPLAREPDRPRPTGRAIVLLDRRGERIRPVLERSGLRPEVAIPQVGVAAVEPADDRGVASVRRELRGNPAVAGVEPEYRRTARLIPDDPAYSAPDPFAPHGDTYQWHLRDERFPSAWNRSTGAGARLAVIDTGVDGGNPDLGSRIVAAVDQDGRVDSGPATIDEDGHGTHVAGLACATGDNGYGGASSGFGCELIVEKTDLSDASIVNSIIDAARRGADVINMSFGGPGASEAIEDAVRFAWKRDVVMVAAASNENTTHQGLPARALQPKGTGPKLHRGKGLVVTAAQYGGSRAWFRPGKGKGISLAAYGAASASPANPGLFSSFPSNVTLLDTGIGPRVPPCRCRTSFEGDVRFAYIEGTSMASPQVAGAAALIRARRPGIDAKRVIEILKQEAAGNEFRGGLGWGVLDAGAATRVALKPR
jgi:serine protease